MCLYSTYVQIMYHTVPNHSMYDEMEKIDLLAMSLRIYNKYTSALFRKCKSDLVGVHISKFQT